MRCDGIESGDARKFEYVGQKAAVSPCVFRVPHQIVIELLLLCAECRFDLNGSDEVRKFDLEIHFLAAISGQAFTIEARDRASSLKLVQQRD